MDTEAAGHLGDQPKVVERGQYVFIDLLRPVLNAVQRFRVSFAGIAAQGPRPRGKEPEALHGGPRCGAEQGSVCHVALPGKGSGRRGSLKIIFQGKGCALGDEDHPRHQPAWVQDLRCAIPPMTHCAALGKGQTRILRICSPHGRRRFIVPPAPPFRLPLRPPLPVFPRHFPPPPPPLGPCPVPVPPTAKYQAIARSKDRPIRAHR